MISKGVDKCLCTASNSPWEITFLITFYADYCPRFIDNFLFFSGCAPSPTFLFLPHFKIIYNQLLYRSTTTWIVFVKYTNLLPGWDYVFHQTSFMFFILMSYIKRKYIRKYRTFSQFRRRSFATWQFYNKLEQSVAFFWHRWPREVLHHIWSLSLSTAEDTLSIAWDPD